MRSCVPSCWPPVSFGGVSRSSIRDVDVGEQVVGSWVGGGLGRLDGLVDELGHLLVDEVELVATDPHLSGDPLPELLEDVLGLLDPGHLVLPPVGLAVTLEVPVR